MSTTRLQVGAARFNVLYEPTAAFREAGRSATLELYELMGRRARLIGSVLRARSRAEKASLVREFAAFGLPRLADGRLRPVVDRVLPFEQIIDAYADRTPAPINPLAPREELPSGATKLSLLLGR